MRPLRGVGGRHATTRAPPIRPWPAGGSGSADPH